MSRSDEGKLRGLLEAGGVGSGAAQRLAHYGTLLLEANQSFNLTGAKSPEELVPHLLDSLALVPYVAEPLVDVGSGGGLPGIPLALVCGIAVTLIEAAAKKATFLRNAVRELGLAAEVVHERAEAAAHFPHLREQFSSVTARAVASAPAVLELTVPLLRVGGHAALQRGTLSQAEQRAVEDAAPMLGAEFKASLEQEGGRRILLLAKTAPTPNRFPRRTGIPAKRPLCLH